MKCAVQTYSEELNINLKSGKESELFKWFLASLLFGKPIQENVAKKTYQLFALKKLLTPNSILKTGWDGLVEILDMGGYVRYDFSTATKLLKIMQQLNEWYGGKLTNIHKMAKDAGDLEQRLMEFYGVGPVTVNIFLRELRTVWKKANPEPLAIINKLAKKFKVRLPKNRKTEEFVRKEAMLVRHKENKV